MPSPLNQPAPSFTVVASPALAAETVIATSARLNVDTPQYAVVITGLVDITIGTSGTAVTFKLRRGATTSGAEVTNGAVWGPYAVTATDEYQFMVSGSDLPPASHGLEYSLTVTVTNGAATSTVNVVSLTAEVTALT